MCRFSVKAVRAIFVPNFLYRLHQLLQVAAEKSTPTKIAMLEGKVVRFDTIFFTVSVGSVITDQFKE